MTQPATPPSPNYCFVLIDLTTSTTPDALRPAPIFDALMADLQEQIDGPYAAARGKVTTSFRVGAGPDDRGPGEIAIHFRDTIPEAPSALAYHTVTNGIPDIEIGCDLFTTLKDGPDSLTGGVSHEVLETLGDPGGNGWKDLQDASNKTRAEENCDIVQNTGYVGSHGCYLSNFIYEALFIPGAPPPYDYLGVLQSQTDRSNGYEILATAPTDGAPVQGFLGEGQNLHEGHHVHLAEDSTPLTELQLRRKAHPYSRTYRRGVRL